MKYITCLLVLSVLAGVAACASGPEKPKQRMPLPVGLSVSPQVRQQTQEGTREYQGGHYDEAKSAFEKAVTGAPNSGEAHYNLGLVLFTLGETDQARDHFIEAANLAPGNKVIWDSPALRPYGEPDPNIAKKKIEYKGRGGQKGGIGPGGGGGGSGR
jgi:Tfp pilus assembly protein PilF